MKTTMKQRIKKQQFYNNHKQSFNNEKPMKHTKETRKWNTIMTKTLKHSNDTQQLKTTIVLQWKKNETQECKNNRSTIIQQSFNNEKPMKHTNETQKLKTRLKNSNDTAMKNNNLATMKTTMIHMNERTKIVQQSYNNRSTMKNQWNTRMKHDNDTQQRKKHRNAAMTLSNEKQQTYNIETNNETKEQKTTILLQS